MSATVRRSPVWATALSFLTALTTSGAVGLAAQERSDTGSPIRIHSSGGDSILEGRLVSMSSTELVYRTPAGEELRMDRRSVNFLEILRERGRENMGFAVGAMAGAMTWGVVSLATIDPDGVNQDHHANIAFTPLTGGAVGGLVGWLLGRSIRTTAWEPVVILESPGRPGGGIGVRLKVGF